MVLETGAQGIEPVFTSGASGERRRRSVAAVQGWQAPNLADEPIAVAVRHGQAADEHVWPFALEHRQPLDRRLNGGHAGAALTQGLDNHFPYVRYVFDDQHANTLSQKSESPLQVIGLIP